MALLLSLYFNHRNYKLNLPHKRRLTLNHVSKQLADDEEIRMRFRFNREQISSIITLLQPHLSRFQMGTRPLGADTQILAALRYYASGAHFRVIADSIGIDEKSVRNSVWSVTSLLYNLSSRYIKFPNSQRGLNRAMQSFYAIGGFPNVIGAVDGTLIKIRKPSPERENSFICRKDYHALNVQFICSGEMLFINCFPRFPGSSHDAGIWRRSSIRKFLSELNLSECWLLEDAGYPLEPWLITPISNPQNRAEER